MPEELSSTIEGVDSEERETLREIRRVAELSDDPVVVAVRSTGEVAFLNAPAEELLAGTAALEEFSLLCRGAERAGSSEWTIEVNTYTHHVQFALDAGPFRLWRVGGDRHDAQQRGRRSRIAQKLERTERFQLVGKIAGGMAHQFNNLLSVILNHAELASEDPNVSATTVEDLNHVRGAALDASELTRRLLVFARDDMAKPEFVSVRESIRSVVESTQQRVSLAWCVPEDDGFHVWVHRGQWHEALSELLQNAEDAIEEGGTIELRVSRKTVEEPNSPVAQGVYVQIQIIDDGIGMSETVARRAFEPFFTTKSTLGSGLGLSVAYAICENFGGSIEIDSSEGSGTNVTILLPEHNSGPPKPDEQEDEGESTATDKQVRTILVVEDEPGVLRAVERILSAHGFNLLTASNGDDALAIFEQHGGDIDLLLTDVVMPGMSGVQLAKKVMRTFEDLPVLYMSGYTESALSLDQLVAGKTDLILKPFTATDLIEVIEIHLSS